MLNPNDKPDFNLVRKSVSKTRLTDCYTVTITAYHDELGRDLLEPFKPFYKHNPVHMENLQSLLKLLRTMEDGGFNGEALPDWRETLPEFCGWFHQDYEGEEFDEYEHRYTKAAQASKEHDAPYWPDACGEELYALYKYEIFEYDENSFKHSVKAE